jgi:hypothetical protein
MKSQLNIHLKRIKKEKVKKIRESIINAKNSTKIFKDGATLLKDALRD